MHAGIIFLASLVCYWSVACWDSLSILLNAGIVCPASLAYDWVLNAGIAWLHLAYWNNMFSFPGM